MARLDVTVPSYGMTEGDTYIQKWLVTAGSAVAEGAPLVLVETAKAETEIESPVAGVVGDLLCEADTEVPPGTVLTWIESVG
ncbi:MAG TPA: biotin/lipoyl-containing protein [Mycobacteriales bacterium]|nr:biotin/lipoyl-containing protein [Mycobacteriales bacterium]